MTDGKHQLLPHTSYTGILIQQKCHRCLLCQQQTKQSKERENKLHLYLKIRDITRFYCPSESFPATRIYDPTVPVPRTPYTSLASTLVIASFFGHLTHDAQAVKKARPVLNSQKGPPGTEGIAGAFDRSCDRRALLTSARVAASIC